MKRSDGSVFRLTVHQEAKMTLDFATTQVGKMHYKLYFICDSYLGADQEFDLKFRVEGNFPFFCRIYFRNQFFVFQKIWHFLLIVANFN